MDSVPLSWYYSPHCRWLMSLFNSKGKLKRLLRNGEFPLFQHMPVFESEFMQVTKRGEVVSVHNRVHVTTVGITYSTPKLLPLQLVKLSIYSHEKKQLRLKLASGCSFYLQLCPTSQAERLFRYWEDLVCLLQLPAEAFSDAPVDPAGTMDVPVLQAEDKKSPAGCLCTHSTGHKSHHM
ncbi:hypothetical protein MC885_011591 [Smutsia gigantea]|nr:hypothetical protein MC885_011591 [Smutsia gigantea]